MSILAGDPHVCISGFINDTESAEECRGLIPESRGCEDALISERCLTLSFADRVECWSLKPTGKVLGWSGVRDPSDNTGNVDPRGPLLFAFYCFLNTLISN